MKYNVDTTGNISVSSWLRLLETEISTLEIVEAFLDLFLKCLAQRFDSVMLLLRWALDLLEESFGDRARTDTMIRHMSSPGLLRRTLAVL